MKKRLAYLMGFFALILLFFIVQKPGFMFYNDAVGRGVPALDYFKVMWHGISLDAATTGYLTALPWLVISISIWFKHFPLRKIIVIYYIFISLIVATIFVGDMCLYPFWNFKLDASVFFYLESPKNAAASVSIGFITLRILIILLLAGIMCWVLYYFTPRCLPYVRKRLAATLSTLLIGGLLFLIIRGGVSESTSNIGQVYFCNDDFLNHSAVNPAFSLLASISKTKDYASQYDYFDEAERKTLFDGLYPTKGKNTVELLNTHRPNILIILMEGFGATMIESLGGTKGASPNIDRLAKEGIWFTHCYANSFRTDRGTICALSGYQSFPDLSVMKIPAKSRTLPSIAGKLVKEGYHTDFLYGGDINFTNMKSYLLQSGYQKLTADVDFPMNQHQNAWGVNDDITFDHLFQMLTERQETPWHTTFLTLSSHEPFEVPYHRLPEAKPNAFAFTDHCLGEFVEKLKQTPIWKDLLIICLSDHGFYYPDNSGHGHDERIHHIPMLWLGGSVKQPMVIDCIMNQTDLAATLLAQLGIDHSEFNFSRNVLGTEYTYPFAYWSFGGGYAFADSTGVTVMDLNADRPMIERPSSNTNRILRGKAILQSSYDDIGAR